MTREKRLGRGLEALLGRPASDFGADAAVAGDPSPSVDNGFSRIDVRAIDSNPFQPRRDFDEGEIATLAESLQEHGLLQPILVRPQAGRFQLVSGERRLRAAIRAGWTEIAAQVRDVDDRQVAEMAIVENLQRRDLNPLEKAASFQAYLQRYGSTQDELAARLGIDRSTIANLIRLLDLPEPVRQAVQSGAISQGHARALLPLGDEDLQIECCRRIQDEGWSVRATEQVVRDALTEESPDTIPVESGQAPKKRPPLSHHLAELQQQLKAALGAKVDLRQTSRGAGRIVIHFRSHEDFDRLFELLCGETANLRRAV